MLPNVVHDCILLPLVLFGGIVPLPVSPFTPYVRLVAIELNTFSVVALDLDGHPEASHKKALCPLGCLDTHRLVELADEQKIDV